MNAKLMSDGVSLLGRFGPMGCGAWLFSSGGEAALFEAPEYSVVKEISPAIVAQRELRSRSLDLKYVMISHPHHDHFMSLWEYRSLFPDAVFIAHKTTSYVRHHDCCGDIVSKPEVWQALPGHDETFDLLFEENVVEFPLGETFFTILYAPKHSPSDTVIYFNGCLFPGDWWLFEGDPVNCHSAAGASCEAIDRLVAYVSMRKMKVHTVFPSHANNILRDVDFFEMMRRTRKGMERCAAQNGG